MKGPPELFLFFTNYVIHTIQKIFCDIVELEISQRFEEKVLNYAIFLGASVGIIDKFGAIRFLSFCEDGESKLWQHGIIVW